MRRLRGWVAGAFIMLASAISCAEGSFEENASESASNQAALLGGSEPVGLSIFFRNGSARSIDLIGNAPRYLQELDISEQVVTVADEGIDPLFTAPSTASLDWTGVELVEEQWIPGLDGTFTRERYYRNAQWMERPSRFIVASYDASGHRVGPELKFVAGHDNRWGFLDDGFVRRFNARQLAVGCPAPGNCAGATYIAEALVQVRNTSRP